MKQLVLVLCLVSVSRGVLADVVSPPTQPAPSSGLTVPTVPATPATPAGPAASEVQTPPSAAMPAATAPAAFSTPPLRTRSMIQLELRALEQQRREVSLALPIGLLIGGGVATANGIAFLLLGALLKSLPPAQCETTQPCDLELANQLNTAYIVIGAIAGSVGAVMLVIGAIVMANRSGRRRELGNRIFDLRQELQLSVAGISMSVAPTQTGASLQLRY